MDTILKVSNLNITLAKDNKPIIKDVSFEIQSGEVVAIVGDNATGKSSILKAIIRQDETDKNITGEISFCSGKNILEMNQNELQEFRSKIAYVPQKDDYISIGKRVTVLDILLDSAYAYTGRKINKAEISKLFDRYELRTFNSETGKPEFYEKSYPAKLSGGQQRMLSIVSSVALRDNAKLFIIDEPLNNLDCKNAKRISNLITRIHYENPNAGILMVTHCRIFPAITRLITIKNGTIVPNEEEYHCHSCFGLPNKEGYYEFI